MGARCGHAESEVPMRPPCMVLGGRCHRVVLLRSEALPRDPYLSIIWAELVAEGRSLQECPQGT